MFKFLNITLGKLLTLLKERGIRYMWSGNRICLRDNEYDAGICLRYEDDTVYRADVEAPRLGREEFKEFLRYLRRTYELGKAEIYVTPHKPLWVNELEEKLKGLKTLRSVGSICVFDDELNAEVCFKLSNTYGTPNVSNVTVKTVYLGGKEKFKQFLSKLRNKYGVPTYIPIHVITVPEERLEEARWFYVRS